jgi:hypothetical protein
MTNNLEHSKYILKLNENEAKVPVTHSNDSYIFTARKNSDPIRLAGKTTDADANTDLL